MSYGSGEHERTSSFLRTMSKLCRQPGFVKDFKCTSAMPGGKGIYSASDRIEFVYVTGPDFKLHSSDDSIWFEGQLYTVSQPSFFEKNIGEEGAVYSLILIFAFLYALFVWPAMKRVCRWAISRINGEKRGT
jgi:hypothetical protein